MAGNMIMPDNTFFVQLVNFIITILLLNVLLYKPIRGIIKKRNDLMAKQTADIDEFTRTAEGKLSEYEATLDGARKEANDIRAQFKDQGTAEEQGILSAAGEDASSTIKAARAEVADQAAGAQKELEAEVDKYAKQATAKILGQA
jgi:F-type H+-transporting ATPase subunit b